jgi:hypothetical protein
MNRETLTIGTRIRHGGLLGTIRAYGLGSRMYFCEMDDDQREGVHPDDSPLWPGVPVRWWLIRQEFLEC